MTATLETGIEVLDRKLDGGLPAGRVVLLSASPVSQSELFLYEMASVRESIYLTTERTASDVRRTFDRTKTPSETVEVHRVGTENPLEQAKGYITDLSPESTLVIDPIRLLEGQGTEDYRSFLNEVKRRTAETDSLALLHCLDGETVPDQRDRTRYMADIVFSLTTTVRGGTIQNNLAIPKFRGGQALPEAIDLDLTTDVNIDVTRKIA